LSIGIGLETARAFATIHAHVIITGRDMIKGKKAIEDLRQSTKNDQIELIELHLESLESVRLFAEDYIKRNLSLNILICNAGVLPGTLKLTKDGFEYNWGINHLAHFLLVQLLLPILKKSQPSRIIVVSSLANRRTGIDFDDWNWEKRPFNMWFAYAQSKVANILFAKQASQLYVDQGIRSYSLHPGTIFTDIQNELSQEDWDKLGWIDKQTGKPVERIKTPEQGASTTVWAALAPELENQSGAYCENCTISPGVVDPSTPLLYGLAAHSIDMESAKRLWELSENLVDKFLIK
jgi:NAD(P)-dependent dehydrogenase (short-subunit alcohol dehydrogenase family)